MMQHRFEVKLLGQAGCEVAALKPPFDVVAVFHRKGRVPAMIAAVTRRLHSLIGL